MQVQQSLRADEGVGGHSDSTATAFLIPAVPQNMEFCICARPWNSRNTMLPARRVFKGTQKPLSYHCKMLAVLLCGKHGISSTLNRLNAAPPPPEDTQGAERNAKSSRLTDVPLRPFESRSAQQEAIKPDILQPALCDGKAPLSTGDDSHLPPCSVCNTVPEHIQAT